MKDIIYHYCSVETFLSIIKNNTIRLSDLNKMNDYSEMKATLDVIQKCTEKILREKLKDCEPIIMGCKNSTAIKITVDKVFYKMRRYNEIMVFAICFSKHRDLLSQWCRYANDGQGVAIGFSVDNLRQVIDYEDSNTKYEDEKRFRLAQVTYINSKNKVSEELEETAKVIASYIIKAIVTNESECLIDSSEWLNGFLNLERDAILQASAFAKVYDFHEEGEIRLTFSDGLEKSGEEWIDVYKWNPEGPPTRFQKLCPQGLQFRATENDFISFVDIRFDINCNIVENEDETNDPKRIYRYDKSGIIKEIILGSNCRLTGSDVSQLLNYYDYQGAMDVKVHRSHATYRK